jgi:nitroreductase
MRTVSNIIKERRTIDPDVFNGKIVADDIIQKMMEAANWAPNHGQTEPWDFIVFKGENCKKFGEIHAELFKQNTAPEHFLQKKYDKLLHRADNCSHVIICTNKRGNSKNIPALEEICATSAAIQNMLLAATEHHVATFWSTGGMMHEDCFKRYFNYSAEDTVLGVIYVGYTNQPIPEGRRNTDGRAKVRFYN